MRRVMTVIAAGALAAGLVAAPSALAKPRPPKPVHGEAEVLVAPTTYTLDTPVLTVSGNVETDEPCRKNRTLRFAYVNQTGGVTLLTQTTRTNANGDFGVSLPRPEDTSNSGVMVRATVDGELRRGGKKGKGRRHECIAITADSQQLVFVP